MSTTNAASRPNTAADYSASSPSIPNRTEPKLRAITSSAARNLSEGDYALSRRLDDTGLPNPEPLLQNLGRSVVEVLAGVREVEQISRWVSPDVFSAVLQRAQHAKRSRAIRGLSARRPTVRTRACVWQSPRPGVVEASIVVDLGPRVRAVAIRLEAWRGRWRAERIHVL